MLWLPVAQTPSFAQAAAASGVARNFTNASIAGLSRKVTSRSPPTSTPSGDVLIAGNGAALKPVFGLAFVEDRITPATKSPSKTIAAFGGDANAFVTEVLKSVCSAPEVPPAMFDELPTTWPIVFSAAFTDGSVHLILCAVSAAYLAGP